MLLHAGKVGEVHAEVAGEEGRGQEEDGDERELLHGFVLVGRDGVEDEVDHVVGGVAHLVDVCDDERRVVEDVGEVGVRERADGDGGGGGGAVGGAGVGVRAGGVAVVAEGVDEVDGRVDVCAELGDFAGEDVEGLGVLDGGFGEDVEFEFVDGVAVGVGDGDGEVDDGVDDGLDDHAGVAAAAERGFGAAEAVDDGPFDVVGGLLEEGDDGVVGGEEDRDLFDGDGDVLFREGGVLFHEFVAFLVRAAVVLLEGSDGYIRGSPCPIHSVRRAVAVLQAIMALRSFAI